MARQRRGKGNGSAAVAAKEAAIYTMAWGTEHDSIVKPPMRPRTMEQVRMYHKPIAKNIAHPFRRNGQSRTV